MQHPILASCVLSFAAPLAAQIPGVTPLLNGCAATASLVLTGSAQAGGVLQTTQLVGGVGYLHLLVVGFSEPAVVLPSCGCTIHPSLDVVLLPQTYVVCWPTTPACVNVTVAQASLLLPVGSTGQTIYLQGIALADPTSPGLGTLTPCTELGPAAPFAVSAGFAVTAQ